MFRFFFKKEGVRASVLKSLANMDSTVFTDQMMPFGWIFLNLLLAFGSKGFSLSAYRPLYALGQCFCDGKDG